MTDISLLYVVSHPIQYQAPFLRLVAAQTGITLTVAFTDGSAVSRHDVGFGMVVAYDTPLLDGYPWVEASWLELARLIRQSDVVWMHGWQGVRHKVALLMAKVCRTPVLMRGETWSGAYLETPSTKLRLRRLLHRCVDWLTTVHLTIGSRNEEYWRDCGVPTNRMVRLPYAVDNARFQSDANEASIAAEIEALGLDDGRPIVLYAGKLTHRKMPLELLEAWRLSKSAGTDSWLVYAGDGELMTELRQTVAAEPDVRILGFVNQSRLPALYGMADVFVLAGRREPWGLAVNEAMACGTAVIVSNEVGCATDLVDCDVGRVVPPGDESALAVAIAEVTAQARAMGDAAARRVKNFSYDTGLSGLREAIEAAVPRC